MDKGIKTNAELICYRVVGLGAVCRRQQGIYGIAYGIQPQLNARGSSGACAGADLRIGPIDFEAIGIPTGRFIVRVACK